ncbi:hypothetical protein H1R16_06450 [Marnyiella aurantia]|uniref:Uncharacterized protein n=1 Tax=Marnyiella aurantia TaxID=2758037 RepID=A0A7D7LL95_9FLAO|nr:hypothetical protein [Marnyiella aurantia]MBA5247805.1 hypothetical protein [Marnyiella aurantia]QMS97384.1 hypothetical protein H1R16_06450 [Marnyiella aurantia]
MITEAQQHEIVGYLLAKKMSLDVVMELHDHFCTHITELMQKDNITFDEAFASTLVAWKDDLKLHQLGNSRFIPKINKEIAAEKERKVAVHAFIAVAVVLGLLFSATNILSSAQYLVFITVFWGLAIFFPLVFLIIHIKDFLIAWQNKNLKLNAHQKSIIMLAPGYILMQNTILSFESQSRIQQLFYGSFTKIDLATLVTAPLGLLVYMVGLLSMFRFIKDFQPIKPFLHYTKA